MPESIHPPSNLKQTIPKPALPGHASQGQKLAGFHGGPLAGCLCSKTTLDTLLGNVERNSLAQAAGVTRGKIIEL